MSSISVPRGSIRREALEEILKYEAGGRTSVLQRAKEEYKQMLTTENLLEVEDSETHKKVCMRYKQPSISNYTTFGENLKAENTESLLIRHILDIYKTKRLSATCNKAMVEFSLLNDVCTEYKKLKTRQARQNMSKTHSGTSQAYDNIHEPTTGRFPQTVYQQTKVDVASNRFHVDEPVKIDKNILYPESMYKQLEHRSSEQVKDIDKLQKDLKDANQQIDDLRNRLSGFASKQLTEGNPDFTDLSDKNRPTKIAEKFHSIYDEEWTTALEALTLAKRGSETKTEEQAIKLLMEVIKSGDAFCNNYTRRQEENLVIMWNKCIDQPFSSAFGLEPSPGQHTRKMPKNVLAEFRNCRKVESEETIKNAIKIFNTEVLTKLNQKEHPAVVVYASKCIEALWLMAIQDPPMMISWPEEGSKFDSSAYKEYCRKGSYVKLPVWPAVYLHKSGPIVNKGFAMPK